MDGTGRYLLNVLGGIYYGSMNARRHIGIYAGTFDPIHPGHTAFAAQTMRECGLDTVAFLPEPRPRGKQNVTDIAHRLALVECAVGLVSGFEALAVASEHFTVKATLPEIRRVFGDARLTILMGSDVARSLHLWEDIRTLLCCTSLAIGIRINDDPNEVAQVMDQLSQAYGTPVSYALIRAANAAMTSSKIRSCAAGLSVLHPDVFSYIQEHSLYTHCLRQEPS